MNRLSGLLLLALATACGAADAPDDPAPPAASAPASVATTATAYRFGGLIAAAALPHLPVGARRPALGYPGHGFIVGAFRDDAGWQAFARDAGISDLPSVDFSHQMVVFAVLDAHTNQLSPGLWKVDSAGRAVFTFEWNGIEPFYPDHTPATLAVVDRAGVRSIAFRTTEGQDLGSVNLPRS